MSDPYLSVRPMMQTGDLLLWRSGSLLGRLIRWFSKSDVNHAGIVIRFTEYDTERVYTLEALEHGFVLRALSERLLNHNGKAYWVPLVPDCDPLRHAMGRFGLQFVGTQYDYKDLFVQAVKRAHLNPDALFCSEAVAAIWHKAGIPRQSKYAPRPGDIENVAGGRRPVGPEEKGKDGMNHAIGMMPGLIAPTNRWWV